MKNLTQTHSKVKTGFRIKNLNLFRAFIFLYIALSYGTSYGQFHTTLKGQVNQTEYTNATNILINNKDHHNAHIWFNRWKSRFSFEGQRDRFFASANMRIAKDLVVDGSILSKGDIHGGDIHGSDILGGHITANDITVNEVVTDDITVTNSLTVDDKSTDLTQVSINTYKKVKGTALTVAGATHIGPEPDPNGDNLIELNYMGNIDNYLLWVERGIVTEDVAISKVKNWSDFVFDDSYKLRPLNEVETFIKKNKHLPEIPSEAKVKKEGYTLHEMTTKLLQKIEELTLYTIAQQKQLEKLQKEIAVIKNK